HVAGERVQLLEVEVDELPMRGEALDEPAALVGGAQRARAEHRKPRADREQHVRVIDRTTVAIRGVERVRLIAELAPELGERRIVRARRAARVGDAPNAIEHEAAGAFQVLRARLEMREIDDAREPIAVLAPKLL